jgi:hypothetical protein
VEEAGRQVNSSPWRVSSAPGCACSRGAPHSSYALEISQSPCHPITITSCQSRRTAWKATEETGRELMEITECVHLYVRVVVVVVVVVVTAVAAAVHLWGVNG